VHMRVPSARMNGQRVAYSKIANAWYLLQKGVCHLAYPASHIRFAYLCVRQALVHAFGCLGNEAKSLQAAQLKGSLLAVGDIAARRCAPERILEMP